LLLKSLSSAVHSPLNACKLDGPIVETRFQTMKYSRVKFRTDRDGSIIVFENCGCEVEARTFRPCRMHQGDAHQAARPKAEAPKKDEGKSVRNKRTGPDSRLGLPLLPDAALDPDSYLRSVKKIGYMVWTAAGLYIILSCVLDQFSDFLVYWLPAVSFAADNGVWWAQVPALAFLGAIICFGVVATGYHVLSRVLD
jgi:hypothetical protein